MLGRTVASEEIGQDLEYVVGSDPSSDLDLFVVFEHVTGHFGVVVL